MTFKRQYFVLYVEIDIKRIQYLPNSHSQKKKKKIRVINLDLVF